MANLADMRGHQENALTENGEKYLYYERAKCRLLLCV
jgi:hypothetical protein